MEQYCEDEELASTASGAGAFQLLLWLLRGKRTIVAFGVSFAVGGALLSLLLRPQFTATAEILPPQPTPETTVSAMSTRASTASTAMGSLGGIASAVQAKAVADMYAVMVGAGPVVDGLVDEYDLKQVYHVKSATSARRTLQDHTVITALKEGFITIVVRDQDPRLAAQLANGYVEQLRQLMKRMTVNGAAQKRVFYKAQLEKSRNDLANAEVEFKRMELSNHMISVDGQAKTLIEGAANLRAQIAVKQVEMQGLRAYSTEANPQVQIAEKELGALEAQQAKMEQQSTNGYSGEGLDSIPAAELNFVHATRELKYEEDLYDFLLKQYEGAKIDEAQSAPIVQVIQPAVVPEEASSPNRTLIVFGAILLGVLLGSIRVLYRGWRGEMSEDQAQEMSQLRSAALKWNS